MKSNITIKLSTGKSDSLESTFFAVPKAKNASGKNAQNAVLKAFAALVLLMMVGLVEVYPQEISQVNPDYLKNGTEFSDVTLNGLPPGWQYINTGNIAGIVVLLSANPRINDIPIEPGDYVGAFYTDTTTGEIRCGGADYWNGFSNILFPAFLDDPGTPEQEGFAYGQNYLFKVFSWTTMKEYVVDEVEYDAVNYPNTNTCYPLGLSCITNMVCYEVFDAYATAEPNPVCIGNSVDLAAHIFIGTTGNYTYSWTSDPPGLYSDLPNLTFTPVQNTIFYLSVSDGLLTSNHSQNVVVNIDPTAIAGNDITICDDQTAQVEGNVLNAAGLEWSSSGDGVFNNTAINNPTYTPGTIDLSNGSAVLTILAIPNSPCYQSSIDQLTVHLETPPMVILPESLDFCKNQEVWVTATASNFSSIQWLTTGDGTFENQNSLVTHYFPGITDQTNEHFTLLIMVEGNLPCTSYGYDQVNVILIKPPTCTVPTTRTRCENIPVNTSGNATNYSSLLWTTLGDGTFENPAVMVTNYYPGAMDKLNEGTILTLNAFGISSCFGFPASDEMIVILKPLPVVDAGNTNFVCSGSYLQVDAFVQNYSYLTWITTGDGTFSNSYIPNPKYFPGTYDIANQSFILTLTALSISPCSTSISDNLPVTINEAPAASIITQNGQIICRSSNLQLEAIATNYTGVFWLTSGDGTFSDNSILNPLYFPGPVVDVNGQPVFLTLKASPLSGCSEDVINTITATFVNEATAYAGVDATISDIETFTPLATATDVSSVLWSSSGDGEFDEASLISPVYTPGTSDLANGSVALQMTCSSISPCTLVITDDLTLTISRQLDFILQPGWQGFSLFIDMDGQVFSEVLTPVAEKVIYAQQGTEVYWPEYGINTIGAFQNQEGYKLKMSAATSLPVTGFVFNQKTLNLPVGWSILPIISGCSVDYTVLTNQLGTNLIIVTEIGGTGVIWPGTGVYSIPELLPGKAYMIKVSTNCSFVFPQCEN